ncbi:MAG: GNAT family N-acetyltransferase [Candidatus Nanopelagicales bacterium]
MHWRDIAAAVQWEDEIFGADAWSAETLWGELAGVPDQRLYLVSQGDDHLQGYAGLILADGECDVATVVVGEHARGCGIGRTLLARLLDQAASLGATRCHLEVRTDNAAAIELYRGLGFDVVGQREGYYRDGTGAMTMSLDLPLGEAPGATGGTS